MHPLPRRPSTHTLSLIAVLASAALISVFLQGSRPSPIADHAVSSPAEPAALSLEQAPAAPLPFDALIAQAQRHRLNGAYEDAAALYRQAVQRQPSEADAALGAAEALLVAGDNRGALEMAAHALEERPDVADAYVIQAYALAALGRTQQAVDSLEESARLNPLGGYAAFREAELRSDLGDEAGSRMAYQRALDLPMSRIWQTVAARRIGASYVGAGRPSDAAISLQRAAEVAARVETAGEPTWFDGDLVKRASEARRPPILLELASAQQAAGSLLAAVATFTELATDYPTSNEAATALSALELLEMDGGVNAYWRGRILAASGRPREAIASLTAFLAGEPGGLEAAAEYHLALARGAAGDLAGQRLGLQEMGYGHPGSTLAPEALARYARLLEQSGDVDAAVVAYGAVADAFPGSEQGVDSLLRAAALQVRYGNVTSAQSTWQRLADLPPTSRARAQALFWLGRSQSQQSNPAGQETLAEAADTAPRIYEGIRARDLAAGGLAAQPFNRLHMTKLVAASPTADAETCAGWIATWAPTSDSSAATEPLNRIRRLTSVGMSGAAMSEALDAARDLRDRPAALEALARELDNRGLFAPAIYAANALAAASPSGSIDNAPACVQRLAYPLAFADLVQSQAEQNGLDPYVLLALLRQESWFNPRALSPSPAYGVSQVTPPTGAEIARSLRRVGFSIEDLYRPQESITFGAWYLAQQVRTMDNQVLVALAAYNAGPGSALRWTGRNPRMDTEDFVNAIDFAETRTYVRSIYEIYARYRDLYE